MTHSAACVDVMCFSRPLFTGRVATVSVTFSNPDEGATGPSHLGTGDDGST